MNTTRLSVILVCTLIVCLVAPLSFNLAQEVPITLQTLVLFLVAAVFGPRTGFWVATIYIVIGALGVPVFGNFTSGYEKLYGPTAGFIWAFPVISLYLGWVCKASEHSFFIFIIHFFTAHLLLLVPGFLVLDMLRENIDLWQTFLRLLPGLIVKSIIGGIIAAAILKKIPPAWTELKQKASKKPQED